MTDIEHAAANGESSPILELNRVMLLVELGRSDEARQRLSPLLAEDFSEELRSHAQRLQSTIDAAHESAPT